MTEVRGEDLTSGVSNSSRAHHEGVHHTGGMVGLDTSRAGQKCQQKAEEWIKISPREGLVPARQSTVEGRFLTAKLSHFYML